MGRDDAPHSTARSATSQNFGPDSTRARTTAAQGDCVRTADDEEIVTQPMAAMATLLDDSVLEVDVPNNSMRFRNCTESQIRKSANDRHEKPRMRSGVRRFFFLEPARIYADYVMVLPQERTRTSTVLPAST